MHKLKIETKAFLEDLKLLLKKHKAEIACDDEYEGYAECGQDLQIHFDIDDSFDENFYKIKFGKRIAMNDVNKIIKENE